MTPDPCFRLRAGASPISRTANILPWGAADEMAKISPLAASASYLAHLRAAWNHSHPDHPLEHQEVVLTIPASFDEGARALTLQAAKQAGIPRLHLLEEPQAAFYDWLHRHHDGLEAGRYPGADPPSAGDPWRLARPAAAAAAQ